MEEGQKQSLEEVRGRWRIIKFALPMVITIVFISAYGVVDGAFISNFIGTNALASLNILMPAYSLLTALGFMFSTGGSAYVANLLGQKRDDEARRSFSEITVFAVIVSVILMVSSFILMEPIARLLGADDVLIGGSVEYGRILALFVPFLMLQFIFIQFLIVAGKPGMSLASSVAGGMTNLTLDYILIVQCDMGLTGAAIASGLGSLVPTAIGIIYFLNRKRTLHFTRPSTDKRVITKTCLNGVSEMVSELSAAIVILSYNLTMMRFLGPDGVSAITIISYVQFLAMSAIIGYSNGIAPVMSYSHGADDRKRMFELFRTSMGFVIVVSITIFALMEFLTEPIAGLFAQSSENVMNIAVNGAKVFSVGFLMMGVNLYASSLFTSLSNGPVSALISFVRSLILLAPMVIVLPLLFGIDAVWYAFPLTEGLTMILSLTLIYRLNSRYGYLDAIKHSKDQ